MWRLRSKWKWLLRPYCFVYNRDETVEKLVGSKGTLPTRFSTIWVDKKPISEATKHGGSAALGLRPSRKVGLSLRFAFLEGQGDAYRVMYRQLSCLAGDCSPWRAESFFQVNKVHGCSSYGYYTPSCLAGDCSPWRAESFFQVNKIHWCSFYGY